MIAVTLFFLASIRLYTYDFHVVSMLYMYVRAGGILSAGEPVYDFVCVCKGGIVVGVCGCSLVCLFLCVRRYLWISVYLCIFLCVRIYECMYFTSNRTFQEKTHQTDFMPRKQPRKDPVVFRCLHSFVYLKKCYILI